VKTAYIRVGETSLIVPEAFQISIYSADRLSKNAELFSYCGAGKGIGDLIVPESILGCRITLA